MNQNDVNKQWHVNYPSNVGTVTILTPPTRVVPGLRKPYQYEIAGTEALGMVADLKASMRALAKDQPNLLQCDLVATKPVKLGIRLNVFLLGYTHGLCGNPAEGCSKAVWETVTASILKRLEQTLGAGNVAMYIEPWSDKEKFEARFETYVKFKERMA